VSIELVPLIEAPQARYEEFIARVGKLSDQELIDAFNRQVGNTGWTSSRAAYLAALYGEFKNRGFDCNAIGGDQSFSLRKRIKLSGNKIRALDTDMA